jgi:hypothetical protein
MFFFTQGIDAFSGKYGLEMIGITYGKGAI